MTSVRTALSTIDDGSMLDRHDPQNATVIKNRRRFLTAHTMPVDKAARLVTNMLERATVSHDTDYCRYVEVGSADFGNGMSDDGNVVADALITTQKGMPLILPVADCVGAILFDPVYDVLMVSHLGRHSLEQQGASRSVEYLKDVYGSDPADLRVWLSPAPGKEYYPIWALENKGMKEATLEQLQAAGINPRNITDDTRDTVTDTSFYSYSEFLKGNRNEDGDHMIAAVME